MKLIDKIHSEYVHTRRAQRLSEHLSELIPADSKVLDVGCGDGLLAGIIGRKRPDIEIRGVDVLLRENGHFSIDKFDGETLPYLDKSFEVVMFVDVLHHTTDPIILLKEAKRVATECIVIKDHRRDGFLAETTLRFMDYVGNAKHGVNLPYNYWSEMQWRDAGRDLDLVVGNWKQNLGLYNRIVDRFFGRNLHFVATLEINP